MAVELDWKQIRATYADVGGDGALILHLLPDEPVGVEALDMVTVADPYPVDEPPTKSGWFEGPTGYLILLETDPDERLWQWVATLAENLSAAGVRGTLTGPRNAGWVEWAQPLQIAALRENNRLFGMLAYRPLPSPAPYGPGWGAESTTLESVLDHGLGWALADADLAQVMMNYHPFGLDVSTAAAIFEREIRRHDVGRLTSYISNLQRVRGMASKPQPQSTCASTGSRRTPRWTWSETLPSRSSARRATTSRSPGSISTGGARCSMTVDSATTARPSVCTRTSGQNGPRTRAGSRS